MKAQFVQNLGGTADFRPKVTLSYSGAFYIFGNKTKGIGQ